MTDSPSTPRENVPSASVMQFLDLSAEVFDDTDEDEELEGSEDASFLDDSDALRAYNPSSVHLLPSDRNESRSAEEIARGVVERARKRQRTSTSDEIATDEPEDALRVRMRTGKSLFPEDVGVDDSKYILYFIRTTDPSREVAVATKYFPRDCLAFHIPWIKRRVYYWVPNPESLDAMFAARGRSSTAAQRVRVPDDERGALFTMLREREHPYHAGSWVTIKRGKFAGDFGVVEEVVQDGRAITVAAMARLDESKEEQHRARPDKGLADLCWLRDRFRTEDIIHFNDGSYQFRGGRYRNGLRLLRMSVDSIEPAFPFLHDVEPFRLPHLGDLQGVDTYVQAGDLVCVHDGPLKNLVGVVEERIDTDLVLCQLRRIQPPDDDDDDWFSQTSDERREKISTWDYIRNLRRSDILLDLESTSTEERIEGRSTTHIRNVRRYIDVGDEVLVKAGMHSGRTGLVAMQDGDLLSLKFKENEFTREVSRLWVETVFQGPTHVRLHKPRWQEEWWSSDDIVFLQSGKFAGRWARVLDFENKTENVYVVVRGLNGEQDAIERRSRENMVKWSIDIVEEGKLPTATIDNIYGPTRKSPFVGKYVYIWRRGDKSSSTREAKGMYGFVLDVDAERKMARVSYQNKEGMFPLRSLVSGDFLCCLDREHPLSGLEFGRLFARVQEQQAKASRRASLPLPSSVEPAQHPAQPEEGKSMALEPVADFTAPGSWVFHPTVRTYYPGHKVFVRCKRQERAGYITGALGEDHSRCFGSHNKCRVRVHIVWGRTVSETSVDVTDLEPCRPVRKNEKVILIGGEEPWAYEPLTAVGVPKAREQPLKVEMPGKNHSVVEIPAARLTKLEKA